MPTPSHRLPRSVTSSPPLRAPIVHLADASEPGDASVWSTLLRACAYGEHPPLSPPSSFVRRQDFVWSSSPPCLKSIPGLVIQPIRQSPPNEIASTDHAEAGREVLHCPRPFGAGARGDGRRPVFYVNEWRKNTSEVVSSGWAVLLPLRRVLRRASCAPRALIMARSTVAGQVIPGAKGVLRS